ncbi:hypothetical protein [Opitutus terrae]|uniref:Uncharacterized protein n=1 Tax=Opitutus terrae (strain DSM 11246 / JCM 15787 / PB90-1) TaxID=452637 RepID=B1ZRJ7_OPITP|nr:hypothetical protein [Opitutus terrae]ACB77647.1 hypothetical protein Oter_4376 [Opitutus terrae PB90-1]
MKKKPRKNKSKSTSRRPTNKWRAAAIVFLIILIVLVLVDHWEPLTVFAERLIEFIWDTKKEMVEILVCLFELKKK